jgi:hypothetical protein
MIHLPRAICDDPVPAVEHDRLVTLVTDGYAVGKEELTQLRPRLRRHVVAATTIQTKVRPAGTADDRESQHVTTKRQAPSHGLTPFVDTLCCCLCFSQSFTSIAGLAGIA